MESKRNRRDQFDRADPLHLIPEITNTIWAQTPSSAASPRLLTDESCFLVGTEACCRPSAHARAAIEKRELREPQTGDVKSRVREGGGACGASIPCFGLGRFELPTLLGTPLDTFHRL